MSGLTAKMTGAEQGGLGDQTEAMLKMMKHTVETWGGSMDNFVKITNFLTDISEDATAASRDMRKKCLAKIFLLAPECRSWDS